MSLRVDVLFKEIETIVAQSYSFGLDDGLIQLEKLAQKTLANCPENGSLHVHTYQLKINAPGVPQVTREQVWHAALCKAAQPEAFVERIAESQIIGEKRCDGFLRTIAFKDEPGVKLPEDVLIGSEGILFIMRPPKQFVAINRIVLEGGELYMKGTYFEGKPRTQEAFMQSSSSVIQHLKENIDNGKVAQLFAKHYPYGKKSL